MTTLTDFSTERLTAALHPRPVRYFESIGSSNDIAMAWLANGAPDGAIVIADEQTKGRGRLGRTWYAPPATGLLFTLILRPPLSALSRMMMLGGLAVCEAAHEMGIDGVGIKWANDVLVKGRKLCGVLPEAAWNGGLLNGVILGIGVNVSMNFAGSPFADTATTFQAELNAPVDRLELLKRILGRVDAWRGQLESDALFETWRGHLVMLGQYVTVDGRRCIAEDVDPDGALLILDEDGKRQRVIAGDIGVG